MPKAKPIDTATCRLCHRKIIAANIKTDEGPEVILDAETRVYAYNGGNAIPSTKFYPDHADFCSEISRLNKTISAHMDREEAIKAKLEFYEAGGVHPDQEGHDEPQEARDTLDHGEVCCCGHGKENHPHADACDAEGCECWVWEPKTH